MSHIRQRIVRRRAGFTLVEMLVVVAIIAVLVSLTGVAVFRMIGSQQSANTKSELSRLEGQLTQMFRSFEDKAAKDTIVAGTPTGNVYYNIVYNPQSPTSGMAGGDPLRAKVIWSKLRLKQVFPQTFNEALNPAPMPPLPYYNQVLTQLGYTTANTSATSPQPWESSVLLLLALQRGEDGSNLKMEDLGVNSFIADFGPTPNGQTVKGLVDGWHKPLVFSRWPVNSTVLNPPSGAAQAKDNNDPSDPSGLLASTAWQSQYAAQYVQFKAYCHDVPAHISGEATSYRIFPMIASSGADGNLGLNPITFQVTNAVQAADNLYPTLFAAK